MRLLGGMVWVRGSQEAWPGYEVLRRRGPVRGSQGHGPGTRLLGGVARVRGS